MNWKNGRIDQAFRSGWQRARRCQAAFAMLAFLLILASAFVHGPALAQDNAQAAESIASAKPDEANTLSAGFRDKWGVEIIGIRLTAANHMLDFRYKVLDAKKSAPLFERKNKPYLMQVATGKVLDVPAPSKVGPLRNSNQPIAGRIYWMFFGNGRNMIKKGDEVAVIIGDFRAEKLIVE
jgi:hypothetical protein